MAWFQWFSVRPLPTAWDLRLCGWRMALGEGGRGRPIVRLIDASMCEIAPDTLAPALRPCAIALGLPDSAARALWLAMGYADAMPGDALLAELAQRAARAIAPPPGQVSRRVGRLTLDLLSRDAQIDGRRLNLHPREFAVLWRLAEAHGAPVSGRELLRAVFDLDFDPGTNRLAVHVCRLRKKLALAGLGDLLATAPVARGYRLDVTTPAAAPWDERGDRPQRVPIDPPFALEPHFAPDTQFGLDPAVGLGEHARTFEELVR